MTTLVFSDTHLSTRVFKKKFNYLKAIIEPADQIVIVGDFWDGFLTTLDSFVESGWSQLFPLLRERNTLYVYGNHDRAEWSNHLVNRFSVEQALAIDLTLHGQQYHITHGHTVFTSMEDKYPIFNHSIPLRIGANLDVLHKLVWGRRFLSKDSNINNPMRHWPQAAPETILICGHSHYPEIDLKHNFINPGFIGMGYGNHVIIDQNGARLVKERY